MSRSNNTELKTPCVRFFEWSGSSGQLKWYDKEKKENQYLSLPFPFLVLDRLSTVTGYSDTAHSGFWSNEVRNSTTDKLTVRNKGGVVAEGVWKQLPAITGLKYAQSIYIAFKDESGELVIGNIKASGSFLSAWIEFTKRTNIYEGAVSITGAQEARKGATKYFTPVLVGKNSQPQTHDRAIALDKILQDYLTQYFQRRAEYVEPASQVTDEGESYQDETHIAPPAPPTWMPPEDDDLGDDIPF